MPRPNTRIVALIGPGHHPAIMVNALADHFGPFPVLLEDAEDRKHFLARRMRQLGRFQVAGQFPVMMWTKLGKRFHARRIAGIVKENGLRTELSDALAVSRIGSVNSEAARNALRRLNPEVVFVAGTRIIRHDTLSCVQAPFINYHAGINPGYRGMNGGYFALANGDPQNYGTTVHLVDEGVDTGGVLYRTFIQPDERDTIHTHAYALAAGSRDACIRAVSDALESNLRPVRVEGVSRQWYHPTVWSYLWTGITRGIW